MSNSISKWIVLAGLFATLGACAKMPVLDDIFGHEAHRFDAIVSAYATPEIFGHNSQSRIHGNPFSLFDGASEQFGRADYFKADPLGAASFPLEAVPKGGIDANSADQQKAVQTSRYQPPRIKKEVIKLNNANTVNVSKVNRRSELTQLDRRIANQTEFKVFEYGMPGEVISWENPISGHSGQIHAGQKYQKDGVTCREFVHKLDIGAKKETLSGTTCQKSDGTWQADAN